MSTATDTTITADVPAPQTEAELVAPTRKHRVDARAKQLYTEALKRQKGKPISECAPEKELRKQTRAEARQQIRTEDAKAFARRAAAGAWSQLQSVAHRNRHQLAPWMLTAPYAAAGEAAMLLATYGDGSPIGISAAVAATAVGTSILAWRRKLAAAVPQKYAARTKASMAMLGAWASLMPLTQALHPAGMWLALLGGVSWLGLEWWRDHEHPIPVDMLLDLDTDLGGAIADELAATLDDDLLDLDGAAGVDVADVQPGEQRSAVLTPEEAVAQAVAVLARGVEETWAEDVAVATGAVPRSTIAYNGRRGNSAVFTVTLDSRGQVTAQGINSRVSRVALAIGVFETQLSFSPGDRVDQVIMRVTVNPPSSAYEGPVVLCDGKRISSRWEITPGSNVDIVVGPYLDGEGAAVYRVISDGSVNSAFILGSIGSGKTLLAEQIAIALRMIGCEIWYTDGQDGASSTMLANNADWYIPLSLDDVDGLYQAVKGVADGRNSELRTEPWRENKYTYDPKRPPVIVILEEAQTVFGMMSALGRTYGALFGEQGRKIRKNGIAFVVISQDLDMQSTFGGDDMLRNCLMAGGNFFAMRFTSGARKGMLPSGCPDLTVVPKHGFGYSPFSTRPEAMWRAVNIMNSTRTKDEWMKLFPSAELDLMARRRAGKPYRNRHNRAEESLAEAMREKEFYLTASDAEIEEYEARKKTGQQVLATAARPATKPGQPNVVSFPGPATAAAPAAAAPVPAAPGGSAAPTAAEQRVLLLVRAEPQTRNSLAELLDTTPQGAGKHLISLVNKGYLTKSDDGIYSAV